MIRVLSSLSGIHVRVVTKKKIPSIKNELYSYNFCIFSFKEWCMWWYKESLVGVNNCVHPCYDIFVPSAKHLWVDVGFWKFRFPEKGFGIRASMDSKWSPWMLTGYYTRWQPTQRNAHINMIGGYGFYKFLATYNIAASLLLLLSNGCCCSCFPFPR